MEQSIVLRSALTRGGSTMGTPLTTRRRRWSSGLVWLGWSFASICKSSIPSSLGVCAGARVCAAVYFNLELVTTDTHPHESPLGEPTEDPLDAWRVIAWQQVTIDDDGAILEGPADRRGGANVTDNVVGGHVMVKAGLEIDQIAQATGGLVTDQLVAAVAQHLRSQRPGQARDRALDLLLHHARRVCAGATPPATSEVGKVAQAVAHNGINLFRLIAVGIHGQS